MVTTATCETCGNEFEAKRSFGRFCTPKCRARAHRTKKPSKKKPAATPPVDEPPASSGYPAMAKTVTRVTYDELDACGRAETPMGRLALALALRLDQADPDASGSAVAALSKELRATLLAATANAQRADDPVDELKARREARRRGA